jgi:hypothetical protein
VQHIAELISLGMTFPTVILAMAVVYTWLPSARDAIRSNSITAQDWFIVGVVAGFTGSILDNIYWFFPWTASYLGHESFQTLTNAGVFFNIIFRQGLGIIAAYCHLRAAELSSNRKIKGINTLLFTSHLIGVGYSLMLILTSVI